MLYIIFYTFLNIKGNFNSITFKNTNSDLLNQNMLTVCGEISKKLKPPFEVSLVNLIDNHVETQKLTENKSFCFYNINATDSLRIMVSVKDKKNRPVSDFTLSQHEPKPPKFEEFTETISVENKTSNQFDKLTNNSKVLDEFEVVAKKRKQEVDQNVFKLYGKPDYVVKVENEGKSTVADNVITYLQGRVPGLNIVENLDRGFSIERQYKVRSRGRVGFSETITPGDNATRTYEPLILLDGVPLENVNSLSSVNIQSIERIEVINRLNPIFGLRGSNGVIAVYTNKAGVVYDQKAKVFPEYKYFSSKAYENPVEFRVSEGNFATLLWMPNVTTDQFGELILKFDTKSKKGTYLLEVISLDGINQQKFQRIIRIE